MDGAQLGRDLAKVAGCAIAAVLICAGGAGVLIGLWLAG